MNPALKGTEELPQYPIGPLGLIALPGSEEFAALIDRYIASRRQKIVLDNPAYQRAPGSLRDSFVIPSKCVRFANGEGKAIIEETVRGYDIYIIADIGNYSSTFKMFGMDCPMSPDDHFQNLKRLIAAIGGKARRLTVVMPMLYEGRQHRRNTRESLDCALALQELERLGVENIITFDAHDPRVLNAVPLIGIENLMPTYQMLKSLFAHEENLKIDKQNMLVVSPDEGAIGRSLYYATMLDVNIGVYYKQRDYTRLVDGTNPIEKHVFLGRSEDVAGKDILIVDDLLSSGSSSLDIARDLKHLGANRIFIAITFALFVQGVEDFARSYEEGVISRLYATNLTYRRPELRAAPWFFEVDMSEFTAYMIDMLNHDNSISALFDPTTKIDELLRFYHENRHVP